MESSRKLFVARPELWIGAVSHRSVQRFASTSASASAAKASRRPAWTSASIRRSQAATSNSRNQFRNATSSAADKLRTAVSMSLTVLINNRIICSVQTRWKFGNRSGDPGCREWATASSTQRSKADRLKPEGSPATSALDPCSLIRIITEIHLQLADKFFTTL